MVLDHCCQLGAEYYNKSRIIGESDNFFITPTIGSIGIRGYLLIVSKEHFDGVGNIPEELHRELNEVVQSCRRVLKEVYGSGSLVFEHGPRVCSIRGGGCLDHAHIHVVPGVDVMDGVAVDLWKRLEDSGNFFRAERIEGFKRIAEIYFQRKCSYLMVESPDLRRFVTEVNIQIPSQYLRRAIGTKLGRPDWNWRLNPDSETFNRTLDDLVGKL